MSELVENTTQILDHWGIGYAEGIAEVQAAVKKATGKTCSEEQAQVEINALNEEGSFAIFAAECGYTRDTALGMLTGANALRKFLARGWVNKFIGGMNLIARGALLVGGVYLGVSRRRARKAAAAEAAAVAAVAEAAEAFAEAA